MSVDICGGGRLGVAQACRHGAHIGAVGNHKRRICMPQRVECCTFRQSNLPREGCKPAGEGRGIHWTAVQSRKQAIIVLPFITQFETLARLPATILLEHVKGRLRQLDGAHGFGRLRCFGVCAALGEIHGVSPDCNRAAVPVYIFPFESEYFAAAHTAVQQQVNCGAVFNINMR